MKPLVIFKFAIYVTLVSFLSFTQQSCSGDNEEPGHKAVEVPPSLNETNETQGMIRISLTEDQKVQLNIKTHVVEADKFTYNLAVPGITFPAPDKFAIVSAPISGRVVAVHAHEGEQVRKGDLLVELESLEYANMVADYLRNSADENYAALQLDRIETLVEKGISPERSLEKAEADLFRAKAVVQASTARLEAVGVKPDEMESWLAGEHGESRLKLYATISGTISEHLIDLGQAVESNEKLLTIVDLSKVLVRGYASPEDGESIRPGNALSVSLKEYPDRELMAHVTTINPSLDELNKSISINVIVETPDHWPKPGQNVRLNINVTTPEPVLTIPLSAIEYETDQPTVFVQVNPLTFEKRTVQIQRLTADTAILRGGLRPGEQIAVSQVFSLKALGKYEEFAE